MLSGRTLVADKVYSMIVYEFDINEGFQEVQVISTNPGDSWIHTVTISFDENYLLAGFKYGLVSIYRKDTQYIKIQNFTISTEVTEAIGISLDNEFMTSGTDIC